MSKLVNDFDINKEFNNKMQEAAYLYSKQKYEKIFADDIFIKKLASYNRRRKRNCIMRTVAVIMVVILTGTSSMIWFNNDGVYGGKRVLDKCISAISPLETEEEVDDDGNVFQVIIIQNESDIEELKKYVDEVRGPEYIPDGYSFEKLTVRRHSDLIDFEYLYSNVEEKNIIIVSFKYYKYDPEIMVLGEKYLSMETGQEMYVAELSDSGEFVVTEITDKYSCIISGKGDENIGIRMMESIQKY